MNPTEAPCLLAYVISVARGTFAATKCMKCILQPTSEKRQSVKRPHFLTIPRWLNFSKLPPELGRHYEEGLWIIHSLFGRRLYDSRRDDPDEWLTLNFKVMANIVRRRCVKDWLSFLESEFIESRDGSYQPKVRSKEYRMKDKYRIQAGKQHQVRDPMVIEKLDDWRDSREDWKSDQTMLTLRGNLDKITIKRQAATDYVYHKKSYESPDIIDPLAARRSDETAIEALASKSRFFVVDDYRRVHTNLTNLDRELRQFLRLRNSKPLALVDIRNSQPFIFGVLLHQLLGMSDDIQDDKTAELARQVYGYVRRVADEDDIPTVMEERAVNVRPSRIHPLPPPAPPLPPTPLCVTKLGDNRTDFSSEVVNNEQFTVKKDGHLLQKCCESVISTIRLAKTHVVEIEQYMSMCSEGVLYEQFQDWLRPSSAYRLLPRDVLKREFFRETIYCQSVTMPYRELRDIFVARFPGIWSVIRQIKATHHSVLPKLMQARESYYIRKAVEDFLKEHPKRFLATIHDSLMVEQELSGFASECIYRAFEGIPLSLKVESLSWHSL